MKINKPIRTAIAGLGRAGWLLHFEPLLEMHDFKIVAIADPDEAKRTEASEKTSCRGYPSLDPMLEAEDDLDLVVVATPQNFHYAEANAVMERGLSCILEKPMALTFEEADELVELSEKKGVGLFVHHQCCFHPEFNAFRSILESGKLGPLFHFRLCWAGYARRWDWQTLRKNNGGTLNNTCPHALSIILPLLGAQVQTVTGDLRLIKDAGDAEDHVFICMDTGKGVTADMMVTTACALPSPRFVLMGKHGTCSCDGKTLQLRYYDPVAFPLPEVIDSAAPGRAYLTEELPWQTENLEVDAYVSDLTFHEDVRRCLLEGASPRIPPREAAEVIRVIEMARACAK